MALIRAWSNLCFQARLIKTTEGLAPSRPSRTMLEAYLHGGGPDGEPALLVDCMQPVTAAFLSNIRSLLERAGGALAAQNAVAYRFNHVGRLAFAPGADAKAIGAHARLAEAVVQHADGSVEVLTDASELGGVETQLARNGLRASMRGVVHRAWKQIAIERGAPAVAGLLAIAGLESVLGLYTDAAFTDEVLAQL